MKTPSGINSHPAAQVDRSIEALRKAASVCRACPLWENATQTVFGEGPPHAPVMLIGAQPRDQEDLRASPAGQLPTRALAAVDIPREQVYVTNAVKHFKFELRGKRRQKRLTNILRHLLNDAHAGNWISHKCVNKEASAASFLRMVAPASDFFPRVLRQAKTWDRVTVLKSCGRSMPTNCMKPHKSFS